MLTNRSAPPATVTPVLVYPDVRGAVAWLERGLRLRGAGADRRGAPGAAGVGEDGAIVVADVRRDQVAPTEASSRSSKLRVPDVDAAFARACEAGARVLEEPESHEYGERSCVVEDPAGHRWELTQTVQDVDPVDWGGEGSW